MKLKETLMPIIFGLGYGYLSFWWIVLALAFAFPDTSPGCKDWVEDAPFIPIGYVMLILYVILAVILVIKTRKDKKKLFIFLISVILMSSFIFLLKMKR